MEYNQIENNIGEKVSDWLENFGNNPIKNGAKVLILFWLFKKLWNWLSLNK